MKVYALVKETHCQPLLIRVFTSRNKAVNRFYDGEYDVYEGDIYGVLEIDANDGTFLTMIERTQAPEDVLLAGYRD